jgi:hypothetical protein
MNKNLHLVPELVINLCDKFKLAKHENEILNMQLRLEACKEYIEETLNSKKNNFFNYRKR